MISPNSTLLFMGDSITDCGKDVQGELTPWSTGTGLGRGYVALVNAGLTTARPADRIRVINKGVGGRTVRDIKANWENEVTANKPNWLSLMIGINDVWRQFDCPLRKETHVNLSEYETTLDALLAKTRPTLDGLVLVTPFLIESNKQDAMRIVMDQYGAAMKKLATKHNAILVDTQAAFDELTAHRHPMEIAWDRIHPDLVGHTLLAKAWLKAVGY